MYEEFKDKHIAVIGDIMLDRYIYGNVKRISPEAPIPVVHALDQMDQLGGAANVANNIISLGASCTLFGVVGDDEYGKKIDALCKEGGISKKGILVDENKPTIVKIRIIGGNNHQLLRLDYEEQFSLTSEHISMLVERIEKTNPDAILISDYNKGMMNKTLVKAITSLAKEKNIPIVVDTKPENISFYSQVTLLTPNVKEASEMTLINDDILEMGKQLVKKTKSNVFITRGSEGISIFDLKENHTHVPSIKIAKVFDVTGAGDTVAAVSALCLSAGMTLEETAALANTAGGIVVQKPGTATITINDLKEAQRQHISHYLEESIEVKQKVIEHQLEKIEKAANLVIDAYKHKKKVIAFGNGGSASDAQHLVGELVGRFKIERKALPAIALTTDSSVVTAIANDYGYDQVFARQVEGNANPGDVIVGISTSGNSPNVIQAIEQAKSMGCFTIGLLGKEGGKMANMCDVSIIVPSNNTPRIQEAHIAIIHIICELLDKELSKL